MRHIEAVADIGICDFRNQRVLSRARTGLAGFKHEIFIHLHMDEIAVYKQRYSVSKQIRGIERSQVHILLHHLFWVGHLKKAEPFSGSVAGFKFRVQGGGPGLAVEMIQHHPAP